MRTDGKTNPQTATGLEITKLSTVKNPAHAPALAAIIKSAALSCDDENVIKQTFLEAMGEIQLEEQTDQLMNGIWDSIWALRKSIRNTMDEAAVANKKEVITNNIADFATSLSGIIAATTVIKSGGLDMKKEEIAAMLKEAVEPLNAKLVIAETLAKMNDVTKAHYNTLDEDGKLAFITKSAEEQATDVAAVTAAAEALKKSKAAGEESIVLHGEKIVKSVVGAGVFTILKAQQLEIDSSKKEAKIEKEARQIGEFTKMAEGLYPNLPGDAKIKGHVMKAISDMSDKTIQDALTTMLKSGNEGIEVAKAFDEVGHNFAPAGESSPMAKLNKMAEDKAATDSITFANAYDEVLKTSEGADLYAETLKK